MKVLPLQSSFSFFPKTGFALPGLLVFVLFFVFFILHINFKIRLSISVKKTCWDFDKDGVDAIGQFGGDLPLSNIGLLICEHETSPFIQIIFHFPQRCFVVFSVRVMLFLYEIYSCFILFAATERNCFS